MKTKLLFITLCSIITFSHQAFADIYLEPYLGSFVNGRLEGDTPTELEDLSDAVGDDYDDVFKMSGSFLGARGGLSVGPLALGADVQTSSSLSIGDWESGSLTETGVFVAFEMPMLLRFYYTYILSSTLETSEDDAVQTFSEGSGYKVGVGLTMLPLVSINFELKNVVYSGYDYTIDGDSLWDIAAYEALGVDEDLADHQNTLNTFQVSISIPFDF